MTAARSRRAQHGPGLNELINRRLQCEAHVDQSLPASAKARLMEVGKGTTDQGVRASVPFENGGGSLPGGRTVHRPFSVHSGGRAVAEGVRVPLTRSSMTLRQIDMHGVRSCDSAEELSILQRLEAESIHILREVVAACERPVLLYSIGKDSSVLLHLARKAFHPAKPPFPLLHIDTTWKFREMIVFRDTTAQRLGVDLLVYTNPDGQRMGINPFRDGPASYTHVMKTQALKQAIEKYRFDSAVGGARRDEEKSRAKERVFSLRSAHHQWNPKGQRPELWRVYNARKRPGETFRVFPLSNWTELDIWMYIYVEQIPVVPLYFAAARPVVRRDGMWIVVDDDRLPLAPGEIPELRHVRFRTLGCYPLTGAIESRASTVPAVIAEMLETRHSERQGRLIDHDQAASMEKKKIDGYF
jgi:sulfate adenylyltransferase subunit 2